MTERMKTVVLTIAGVGAIVCLLMLCVVTSSYDAHLEGADMYHGWVLMDVYHDSAAAYMILSSPETHMKRRVRCTHGVHAFQEHHHVGDILP